MAKEPFEEIVPGKLCGRRHGTEVGHAPERVTVYVDCQRERGHDGDHAASFTRDYLTWSYYE